VRRRALMIDVYFTIQSCISLCLRICLCLHRDLSLPLPPFRPLPALVDASFPTRMKESVDAQLKELADLKALLKACTDAGNASSAEAQNAIDSGAAKLRAAESALEEMQHRMASAEANRQEAQAAAAASEAQGQRLRDELDACTRKPCGAREEASAQGGGAQALKWDAMQSEAIKSDAIRQLSPDALKLSPDSAAAEGPGDEDGELCGLTPDSCGNAADTAASGSTMQDEKIGADSSAETSTSAHVLPVVTMSGAQLEAHVAKQAAEGGLTFVKFFAPWCGHCKKLAPVWDEVGQRFRTTPGVTLAKVDCTQAQELCKGLGIEGLPTLKLFQDTKVLDYKGKKDLQSLVAFVQSSSGSTTAPSHDKGLSADARDAAHDQTDDAAACGLTPGSCGGDATLDAESSVAAVSGGAGTSVANNRSAGQMSEDEIALMYEKIKQGGSASAPRRAATASPKLDEVKAEGSVKDKASTINAKQEASTAAAASKPPGTYSQKSPIFVSFIQ